MKMVCDVEKKKKKLIYAIFNLKKIIILSTNWNWIKKWLKVI